MLLIRSLIGATRVVAALVSSAALGQTQITSAPLASITGVIRESTTGMPMAGVTVIVIGAGSVELATKQSTTDASGRYSCSNIAAGQIRIHAQQGRDGVIVEKSVLLAPAQYLTLDIPIPAPGQISGRITDEDRNPLKGIRVSLISADYAYGALRYATASSGITNGDGEYTIPRVSPGRAFFVLAANGLLQSKAISDVPANPENRKSVLMPAYYPGTDRIENATGVTLGPGEKREFIDIQMKSSPSRCLEGILRTLDTTGSVRFEIGEDEPPLWTFGVRMAVQPRVLTAEDGRIRICDLHPGDYWLKT